MTGGMAFEALNHTGHLGKNLIIILNDNEMSISPNVGAISSFLSRKMTSGRVARLKKDMETFLKSFASVGENILQVLKKSEVSFKSFFTPAMLFEAFKIDYVGPIPGHDLGSLIDTMQNVNEFAHRPTLIHVITTKGKGYQPAEEHPDNFHGIGPFEIITGKSKAAKSVIPSYTSVFGSTLEKIAANNSKVVAISAAMTAGTGLSGFAKRFPDRFFDVGIAEQHAVTFAAGLATEGILPVVAIYSTFLQRSLDQILHDVCMPNLPVTLMLDRAGLVGNDGPTHHGVFDLTFLRMAPNMVIMAPKDENELRHMIHTAINHQGPVAVRYPRGIGVGAELTPDLKNLPIGKGEILREGSDLVLIPVGNRVYPALEAAAGLQKIGISAAVINPRFIKPLDRNLILSWAEKIGKVITIEENVRRGGFGSAVLELLADSAASRPITTKVMGLPDHFIEQGPQKILRKIAKIDSTAIIQAGMDICK